MDDQQSSGAAGRPKASARRKARSLALQALYAWHMADLPISDIEAQFRTDNDFSKVDGAYFHELLTSSRLQQRGIVADAQGDRPAGCGPLQSLGAKVAGNQVKLVQRHGRAISVPCGRR